MIDHRLFTVERLVATLLDDRCGNNDKWRKHATIEAPLVPLGPDDPKVLVRFDNSFLRHSKGPRQGFFWDSYGDDFQTPELALLALIHAPVPPWVLKRDDWNNWHEAEIAAEAKQ